MSDFISREAAISAMQDRIKELRAWPVYHREFLIEATHFQEAQERISKLPAADVAPVVRAEWILDGEIYVCSSCPCVTVRKSSYCPNCGALMQEG